MRHTGTPEWITPDLVRDYYANVVPAVARGVEPGNQAILDLIERHEGRDLGFKGLASFHLLKAYCAWPVGIEFAWFTCVKCGGPQDESHESDVMCPRCGFEGTDVSVEDRGPYNEVDATLPWWMSVDEWDGTYEGAR